MIAIANGRNLGLLENIFHDDTRVLLIDLLTKILTEVSTLLSLQRKPRGTLTELSHIDNQKHNLLYICNILPTYKLLITNLFHYCFNYAWFSVC